MCDEIPIIDISDLVNEKQNYNSCAHMIGKACRDYGFFYIINHGIDVTLQKTIEDLSTQFFALPLQEKQKISIRGKTWNGYFGVNDGKGSEHDYKEGIYFAPDSANHSKHNNDDKNEFNGENLYPDILNFRNTIIEWIDAMSLLSKQLIKAIAISLGLDTNHFDHISPILQLRILNYPVFEQLDKNEVVFGIKEHTDYGLLTILKQDNTGGLQIKSKSKWIDATPLNNSFVCNIGDTLDLMTGGQYRSTPHRVKCPTNNNRISIPFFFTPNLKHRMKIIDGFSVRDQANVDRWDNQALYEFNGTFGEYVTIMMNKYW